MESEKKQRESVRQRADEIKAYRCKNLIAVIEEPSDMRNIGTIIRNVNALGVEKAYIVDPKGTLPDDWQDMRQTRMLSKTSVSAIKWSFVKRFDSTEACLKHLEKIAMFRLLLRRILRERKTRFWITLITQSIPSSRCGSGTKQEE
jgi:tRNA (guanosine-2'-O-)-methyltransferase